MVAGILAGVLWVWTSTDPQVTLLATVMFIVAVAATLASAWHTHLRRRPLGENVLYAHVILDVLLVTGIIHITGGHASGFASLYVLVIAEGALLLPLPGGVLIGALASILYFADIFWFYADALSGSTAIEVALRIILFAGVALATGVLGDRLRRAGMALGAVQSELRQLRLDTGDILASINTGVLTVDEEGRLAYLNPAGEALLGLDGRQWLGAPVLDAVDEIAPGMGRVLARTVEEGVPVTRFKTTSQRSGKATILGISTTVLGREEDRPPSATALFQDISDLERVDALNRRAERLEAVAELSASLAHEIKNPLASIRSAVEQITKPVLAAEDRSLLQRLVVSESDRLSRLLTEFLEFSGLTMGSRQVIDLRDVVGDCTALVRQHPDCPDDLEFVLELSEDPAPVHGDRDLLHRAVFNLVLNAVQFSGDGGRVTVSLADHTRRGEQGPQPIVRLSVSDTGPGIDAEDLPRIFDPFYTKRAGGSGLGLSVVQRAVSAHGGTVSVEAAPGGGSDFVVDLPRSGTAMERTARRA